MKKLTVGHLAEIKLINRLIDNAKKGEHWNISLGYDFEFNGVAYELLETRGREYPMVVDYYDRAEMKDVAKNIIVTGKF